MCAILVIAGRIETVGSPVWCPVNRWQAFKLRWFPSWLLSRFPVIWRVDYHYRVVPDLSSEKG